MPEHLESLHHVTATVREAEEDLRCYTDLLGLRLVKKTVNFDNPGVYHLYYGNGRGAPSTVWTTFPYGGKGVPAGTKGAGQITVTTFSVPPGTLGFWRSRVTERGLAAEDGPERFGEKALRFDDPSGLVIELREGPADARSPWVASGVPEEAALRGIHGVTITVRDGERSVGFLEERLGFRTAGRDGDTTRVETGRGGPGAYVEVLHAPDAPRAINGLGTVHHVAFAVADEEAQLRMLEELRSHGLQVTDVRDRQYFRSIYFREPGGVLYEIATRGPGFLIDEDEGELGTGLRLPPWEEPNRDRIEAELPPLSRGPVRK